MTTSREEARARLRQELRERLLRRRQEKEKEPPVETSPLDAESSPLDAESSPLDAESSPLDKEEEREKAREAQWSSFAHTVNGPSLPLPSSRPLPTPLPRHTDRKEQTERTDEGWDQGDGRWAAQVVVYENHLPPSVRARLMPIKETHFRFRKKEEEEAFLSALSSPPEQLATYQSTGKKDITLTSGDGRLLGNIHFLHMDGRDIHHPDKYYMKFYLFNVADAGLLRDMKQRIHRFLQDARYTPEQASSSSRTRPSRTRPSPSRTRPSSSRPSRTRRYRPSRTRRHHRPRRPRPTRRHRRPRPRM